MASTPSKQEQCETSFFENFSRGRYINTTHTHTCTHTPTHVHKTEHACAHTRYETCTCADDVCAERPTTPDPWAGAGPGAPAACPADGAAAAAGPATQSRSPRPEVGQGRASGGTGLKPTKSVSARPSPSTPPPLRMGQSGCGGPCQHRLGPKACPPLPPVSPQNLVMVTVAGVTSVADR